MASNFLRILKMRYFMFSLAILFLTSSFAGAQVNSQEMRKEEMKNNPIMQLSRIPLKNGGDERMARNLLILKEVLDFKMGDEQLQEYFTKVENNRNYYKALEKIMNELNNDKRRNSKNNQIIHILDDAGNKIYNLLGN